MFFLLAVLLAVTLPLEAEFQVWGGSYGGIDDTTKANLLDSLRFDYMFFPDVWSGDTTDADYAFPPIYHSAQCNLDTLNSRMSYEIKIMAQQRHCYDRKGYLDGYETGQGSAILRAAAAHYESWEAESTTVPPEIPSQYLFRTWINEEGSFCTVIDSFVRCTGDTGVAIIAPIAYHKDTAAFDDVDHKMSRQYGYYKQNDGGGQNWHKYPVGYPVDGDIPVVPYTLSIYLRADSTTLPLDSPDAPILAFGVWFDHISGMGDSSNYDSMYVAETLTVDSLRSWGCLSDEFKRVYLRYDWQRAWEDIYTGSNPDVYKKYMFHHYRVYSLNNTAQFDIDRIVCWDEKVEFVNDNGWGKYIFEPEELIPDSVMQDSIWFMVEDQINDFYSPGDTQIYGLAGVTEQSRLPNQWAAAKKFTEFIDTTFGLKSDFIMASAPPEYLYSYLYYTRPTYNRRNTYRFTKPDYIGADYTGIDTSDVLSFQYALNREIEEFDYWRQACKATDNGFAMEEITSNANAMTSDNKRVIYPQEVAVQCYLALAHGIKSIGIAPLFSSGTSAWSRAMDSVIVAGSGFELTGELSYLGQETKKLIEELKIIGPILYDLDFDTAFCAVCGGHTVGDVGRTIPGVAFLTFDSLVGYENSTGTIPIDTNCIEIGFFNAGGDTIGYFMVVNRIANKDSRLLIFILQNGFI